MRYSNQVSRGYYMETTTADGRDLSREEFRVIPGFSKYEITKDGDVRNIRTGKLLDETKATYGDNYYYCLYKEDGKSTHRQWERLVWLAYPELKPPPVKKEPKPKATKPKVTKCRNGHDYTPENTRISPDGKKRECRICTNDRARRRREKDAAERKKAAVTESKKRVGHLVWKPIPGYPNYEMTRLGLVREADSWKQLEPRRNNRGRFYHLTKGYGVVSVQRTALIDLTFPKRSNAA